MFYLDMRMHRTLRAALALLWALMLPLQGYAASPACGQHDPKSPSSAGAPATSTAQHHCTGGAAATHHRDCGNCCGAAAIVLTHPHWIAPLPAPSEISNSVVGFPPTVALDRLDRPPRSIPA
jgi:hypothetical protein